MRHHPNVDFMATVREIEQRAANAWPASMVQIVGGWRFRASPTVSRRRSNSALVTETLSEEFLEVGIEIAEDFYRRRGTAIRFQVTPLSEQMDALLAERGYSTEAKTLVLVSPLRDVAARADPGIESLIELQSDASNEWVGAWATIFELSDAEEQRREILSRIAPPTAYAKARGSGRSIAVGLAVAERGWVGLFGCGTLPEERRKKVGSTLVTRLLRWATEERVLHAYLQVEEENVGARAFYEALGFSTLYSYHYRFKS